VVQYGEQAMKGSELIDLLAPGSLFSGATADQLDAIAARATSRTFDRGAVIIHQGDPGECLYILTSGVARVSIIAANGREITLDFLEQGAVVGEIAVLDGLDRTATVTAIEPVTAMRLDRTAIRDTLFERPDFAWQLLGQMARRLRQANTTIEGDRAYASGPRLARSLVRLMATGPDGARLRHQLNQTDLAHFAGMSREQINRQLSVWADSGIIAREHGKVLINDPDMLMEIAESGE
jgi:CRP/FNR family transcriptional regulator, cyclic AMP receptor protein